MEKKGKLRKLVREREMSENQDVETLHFTIFFLNNKSESLVAGKLAKLLMDEKRAKLPPRRSSPEKWF